MSMVALALRLAARRLIDEAGIPEAKVYDSAITGLDELVKEQQVPIIIVSTEDERATTIGRDILAGERSLDLIVEIAIAKPVQPEDGGAGIAVPVTDAGLEMSVNLMARQTMRALYISTSPWGSLFKRLAPQTTAIQARRGASAQGTRFAARQIIFTIDPLAEPPFGVALDGVWLDFVAALEADPEFAPLAGTIRSAIVGDAIPDWRIPATTLGLTDSEAFGIGILPFVADGDPIDRMTVDGVTMTEDDIERLLPDARDR